jgi:hypothetical protein
MDLVDTEQMDVGVEPARLSYDDAVPYDDQIAVLNASAVDVSAGNPLASRIGKNKIYVLAEAASRDGKVRLTTSFRESRC